MLWPLKCVDSQGHDWWFYFEVRNAASDGEWSITVFDNAAGRGDPGMEFSLVELDPDTLMVHAVQASRSTFIGKGIRDRLYPLLPGLTGRRLCSSSERHPRLANERRNGYGTAVWARLAAARRARYDEVGDRYFLE